ncbi:UNVERIFIED_CONTAM: hypothetical protein GTU68_026490 [Idotea baltica]|nr:hypothetical protein [Idotea baltica]
MSDKIKVTVAKGDGIGPEIMDATLRILEAANAGIEPEFIDIGEKVYLSGHTSGIEASSWDSLRRNKVFLKAPITTPQGKGYKSLNVTIRKTMGLYANVRPSKALHPYVPSRHPEMDLVIIRENEEDLYAGIEHRQTQDVTQCLKLISRPGSEKIVTYAFEYARAYGRKKVTVMIKDNIMKITDGLFHSVFKEIGENYPDIEKEFKIIDIGSALIADTPENFDVIVTTNLYGDIISDIAAQIGGSVGLAGSSNVGEHLAMFEAIHGSAPDIAGMGIANPSGLLNGAIMMLVHLGKADAAEKIYNAWLRTLEDGVHTGDIYEEGNSSRKVNTQEFADAVIERIGQKPEKLKPADFSLAANAKLSKPPVYVRNVQEKQLVGIDIFVDYTTGNTGALANLMESSANASIQLNMIENRGVKVYPNGFAETFTSDHWRCRFVASGTVRNESSDALALQQRLMDAGLDIVKTENLYTFDGERGFTLAQGE